MKRNTIIKASGFAMLILFLGTTMPTYAGPHPEHAPYLHALEHLRTARWLLEHRPGNWKQSEDEMAAVREIDKAINEIKMLRIDDGHDNNWTPTISAEQKERRGRLRQAADLLHRAHADIKDEDTAFGKGLRDRALMHIDAAASATERAMRQ